MPRKAFDTAGGKVEADFCTMEKDGVVVEMPLFFAHSHKCYLDRGWKDVGGKSAPKASKIKADEAPTLKLDAPSKEAPKKGA